MLPPVTASATAAEGRSAAGVWWAGGPDDGGGPLNLTSPWRRRSSSDEEKPHLPFTPNDDQLRKEANVITMAATMSAANKYSNGMFFVVTKCQRYSCDIWPQTWL